MTLLERIDYDLTCRALRGDRKSLSQFLLIRGLWLRKDEIPGEKWRPVVGFENMYEMSDCGRVKSLERIKVQRNGHPITVAERMCGQPFDKDKYLTASLSGGKGNQLKKVHILVARAFCENPLNKPVVNHDNGIRFHNELYNLEFSTISENVKHGFEKNGRVHPMKGKVGALKGWFGAKHHNSRAVVCLDDGIVYGSMLEAGRAIGADGSHIWAVCNGKHKRVRGFSFAYANEDQTELLKKAAHAK